MYRVPWNVICTPWYCVMYHVIDFLLEKGKKYGIKAEYRFVLWYLFVYLALSCENVKISSSPSAHSIFLHFHTQGPNTQTRIISLTTFCYTIMKYNEICVLIRNNAEWDCSWNRLNAEREADLSCSPTKRYCESKHKSNLYFIFISYLP